MNDPRRTGLPAALALTLGVACAPGGLEGAAAKDPNLALCLVPFPKQVQLQDGRFALGRALTLAFPDAPVVSTIAGELERDLVELGKADARRRPGPPAATWRCGLSAKPIDPGRFDRLPALPEGAEGYVLAVGADAVLIAARAEPGLAHGLQTLRQLVRANIRNGTIPCVTVRDWPSLRYRGYSDDITRGASPKLDLVKRELRTTSHLKMNFWTYYMEYQYAFKKHPLIGPKDGSLTPEELKAIVAYGKRHGVEIIGNQQSFGHFAHILKHEKYKHLREKPHLLNPTHEGAIKLLDDLYSEVVPLLESKFFNVCCDETWGLGTGPSKAVAERIGVGAVYADHLRRIHDLLKSKYGKRMMMWGDIIIKHPEHLPKIPKDTVVLSWGYHAAPSFDAAITPFSKSGYEFFVCPGVSCWNRILPDFGVAVTNIRNYVRDGAKHGALGMLNTTWDDDGENFFTVNWHGIAWGAECAWNASTTPYEDFNRRIGPVLFGERADLFRQAIVSLTKTHRLPGYDNMLDRRFWKVEFGKLPIDVRTARRQAEALLELAGGAARGLHAAQRNARFNKDWLDYFGFGAARMQLMATRVLDYLDAALAYDRAIQEPDVRDAALKQAEQKLRKIRDEHSELKRRYVALWHREAKPYSLDRVTKRFDDLIGRYDKLLARLGAAAKELREKGTLPPPAKVGLEVVQLGARRTRPAKSEIHYERAGEPAPTHSGPRHKPVERTTIEVASGNTARRDSPIEVDLPKGVPGKTPKALIDLRPNGASPEIPFQLLEVDGIKRLVCVLYGQTPARKKHLLTLAPIRPQRAESYRMPSALRCTDASEGAKWIENKYFRLLVGPEGGHIYRWEIKALGGRDVTHPGKTNWSGFADVGGAHRNSKNRIEVVASGPALVRLRCTDETGLAKTISAYAGLPWVEVTLNSAVDYFWCFTDTALMAADSKTPGTYLFADGATGKVRKLTGGTACQVDRPKVYWSAKYVPGGPLIALITPEVATRHVVGPGGGMGGVGVERGAPCGHFIIYAGPCPDSPSDTLDALRATLDFRDQPTVKVCAVKLKPSPE